MRKKSALVNHAHVQIAFIDPQDIGKPQSPSKDASILAFDLSRSWLRSGHLGAPGTLARDSNRELSRLEVTRVKRSSYLDKLADENGKPIRYRAPIYEQLPTIPPNLRKTSLDTSMAISMPFWSIPTLVFSMI